jgi:uroporphyrinogen-III synthase
MTRHVAVLRPEPGNRATVAALSEAGLEAIALPLFEIVPVAWTPPDPAAHDALLLTSANALRYAGPALDRFATMPVFAIGTATALEARQAGLDLVATGSDGIAEVAAAAVARGHRRLLHLAGRDRVPTPPGVSAVVTVYESREIDRTPADLQPIEDGVALLHSPRAARRFAALASAIDRRTVRIAALSPAVAEAAGVGWAEIAVAATRDDAALVALARRLAD